MQDEHVRPVRRSCNSAANTPGTTNKPAARIRAKAVRMAAISRLILCEKNSNAACGREENLEREPISRGDAEFAETKRPSSPRSLASA